MIYWQLFLSFLQIGLFSIGGGYAAMPLIQAQVVENHNWLSMTQFTDIITIAEMTPGPIAVNSATFVGIQVAGIPGGIIATLGCIFPSCIIVSILAYVYYRYQGLAVVNGVLSGLRPVVIALIASAGVNIFITALWGENGFSWGLEKINWAAVGIFLVALLVLRKWKPNPIYVMLGCGVIGGVLYTIFPSLL
jgi:chromate transporter